MALTLTQVKSELERRKFPCIFTTDEFQAIIDATLREFDKYVPLVSFAKFNTVTQKSDYYIFDPADTTTRVPDPANPGQYLALCANATNVRDIFWNPGGDWSTLNIFSPGWQMLSQIVLFTGSYFHQPSQIIELRQKLDAWRKSFGEQGFQVYGEVGEPSAFVRINPMPMADENTVVVEFSKNFALTDIGKQSEQAFFMWLEFEVCQSLANYYSQTADVQLLGFADSKSALNYWERQAKIKYDRAIAILGGAQGVVGRT